jgi:hypothetical protein
VLHTSILELADAGVISLQGHLLIAWDDAAPSRLHTCAAAGRLSASSFLQQYAVRCSSSHTTCQVATELATAVLLKRRRASTCPLACGIPCQPCAEDLC